MKSEKVEKINNDSSYLKEHTDYDDNQVNRMGLHLLSNTHTTENHDAGKKVDSLDNDCMIENQKLPKEI